MYSILAIICAYSIVRTIVVDSVSFAIPPLYTIIILHRQVFHYIPSFPVACLKVCLASLWYMDYRLRISLKFSILPLDHWRIGRYEINICQTWQRIAIPFRESSKSDLRGVLKTNSLKLLTPRNSILNNCKRFWKFNTLKLVASTDGIYRHNALTQLYFLQFLAIIYACNIRCRNRQ